MFGHIGSYIIASVVLAGIDIPYLPITLAFSKAFRKARRITPFLTMLLTATKIWLAILLASWIIQIIGQSPTWLMFLIPGCFAIWNDIERIKRVKFGHSNVKSLLEQNNEPQSYDKSHDLWMEWGYFIGDVSGWIIGTNLVLQSAEFF